jgi:phage shock protein A
MTWFLIIVVGAFLLLVVPSKASVLAKGFLNIFFKNAAATPEGAEAIYQEKIEEMQDRYNATSDAVQEIAGELELVKQDLADRRRRLAQVEANADNFAKVGRWEEASLYANQRTELAEEIEQLEMTIQKLAPALDDAKAIHAQTTEILEKLKREQKMVVANLKRDIQTKDMYDMLDKLKRTTNLEKMYGYVQDASREKQKMAVGAKVEYENRTDVKLQKADQAAKQLGGNSYLEQLKAKYNQPQAQK